MDNSVHFFGRSAVYKEKRLTVQKSTSKYFIRKAVVNLAAALLLLIFCAQAKAAENLLTNPGFESGTTGWFGSGCSFTTSTTVYRSGSQSGYAYNRTNTWSSIRQSMLGKMEAGKTYFISGWMKIEGVSSSHINVTVVKTDDSGTTYTWVASTAGYDNQWTKLYGAYTVNVTGTLTDIAIYFEGPDEGVNYYLDDVNVFETGNWKEEANARIEQIRKRDAHITVVDSEEQPVSGVNVWIQQKKHRFAFGSCINYRVLSNTSYANFFKNNYEWAVMENESKWYSNEPTQGNVTYTTADNIYNWCASNGIIMRGHCIYWEVEGAVQDWIKNLPYAPLPATSELRTAVENRMNSAVNHFKDKFIHWDVDNEMLHGSFYKDRLGDAIHPWMFQAAYAIDPNCKLFVNDYSVVSGGETEAYKAQIQDLIDNNAPVHGIGVQCHFSDSTIEPFSVYSRLDSLAELGLPIWCTEYDFVAEDVNVRADGLERFYRTAFSHPAVEGILAWGFWEDSLWRENCHIVNSDWSLNEAGIRYKTLMDEWTTNDANATDSAGNVNFRGFHGTYNITLSVPGEGVEIKTIELDPGQTPAEFTLVLDALVEPNTCDDVNQLGFIRTSDFNGDCYVNYQDLDIIADYWLHTDCAGFSDCDGADFVPTYGVVDFFDLGAFAVEWMLCNNPEDSGCIKNW
jgi:endo-1,4-beta-xylanase